MALTRRPVAPDLDKLLFERRDFGCGVLQAVDYMGNDFSPVESARMSYGDGTKRTLDDERLLRYLMRHGHTTPFEHVELAVEGRSPMFVDPRQAGRHRTLDNHGFMGTWPKGSVTFIPADDQIRFQSTTNKQGRGDLLEAELRDKIRDRMASCAGDKTRLVASLRGCGLDEETIARFKGPGYSTLVWRTGDFHNWGHFLRLRLHPHAQREVRDYAAAVAGLIQAQVPQCHSALRDYRLDAVTFSTPELRALTMLAAQAGFNPDDLEIFRALGMTTTSQKTGVESLTREGQELREKLAKILDV